MNLRDIIQGAADQKEQLYSVVGTVTAVDLDDMSCDVEPSNGDASILGVRLMADPLAGSYVIQVPKVGSAVVVTFLNKATGYLAMCSEIEYIEIKAGTSTLKIDQDGHLIQKGVDSLGSVLSDLITQITLITVTSSAPGSPTSPPLNVAAITALNTRISQILQ